MSPRSKKNHPKAPPSPPAAPPPATPPRSFLRERGRWILWLIGTAGLLGIAMLAWIHWQATRDDEGRDFPLPPYRETRFLNTGSEARYVGVDACTNCHRTKHQSFLLTAHSKAFADVNPADEPPDAAFHHPASGRDYRVYRNDG